MTASPSTAPHLDALFAGAVYCDLVFSDVAVPVPGSEVFSKAFLVTPGGVANRAVAAARLGSTTGLLAELGDDPLGAHVAGLLADEDHLDLRWLRRTPGWQSPVTAALTGAHDRSFVTYEEPGSDPGWSEPGVTVGATHVMVGTELPAWVAELRAAGTVVTAGVGWDPTGLWSGDTLARLAGVDVFIPNEVEAAGYTGLDDPVAAARELGRHVEQVVVTRGPAGAVAYDSGTGELTEVTAPRVTALDPTGAGDVFTASFMTSRDLGWDLATRLRFSCLCASLSVRGLGGAASAPRPADVASYLDAHAPEGDRSEGDRSEGDWSEVRRWAGKAAEGDATGGA